MTMLIDLLPVFAFLIAFKWFGIYTATAVGIVGTFLQVILTRCIKKRFDQQQVITLVLFVVFGGMTLYFHNPIFIKWKPTILFGLFSVILILSQFIGKQTIVERIVNGMLKQSNQSAPKNVCLRMNWTSALFFAVLSAVNIYIAYTYSTDVWVNFKVYGIIVLMLAFSFAQTWYLSRHVRL